MNGWQHISSPALEHWWGTWRYALLNNRPARLCDDHFSSKMIEFLPEIAMFKTDHDALVISSVSAATTDVFERRHPTTVTVAMTTTVVSCYLVDRAVELELVQQRSSTSTLRVKLVWCGGRRRRRSFWNVLRISMMTTATTVGTERHLVRLGGDVQQQGGHVTSLSITWSLGNIGDCFWVTTFFTIVDSSPVEILF